MTAHSGKTPSPYFSLRPGGARGYAHHGWLESWHTFSFADYHDPLEMGFGFLRVLNEDRVIAGEGFPMHGHRDMEVVTWVLEGALEHRDSLGNSAIIRPGEIQRMTAGRGIRHSEYNPLLSEPTHLLQIWIVPEAVGLIPGYAQQAIPDAHLHGRLGLVASRDGREGGITLNQDCDIRVARLAPGQSADHSPAAGRFVYLHVARGQIRLGAGGAEHALAAGDGVKMIDAGAIQLTADSDAEVLVFDMAGSAG